MNKPPRISMFGDPLGGGSTAKIAIRLAKGFVSRSVVTDLLVSQCRHPTLETTTTGIEVIKIATMRPFARVLAMARYLRDRRPAAVLTQSIRENVFNLRAIRRSAMPTSSYITVHGPLTEKLQHMPPEKGRRSRAKILHYYPSTRVSSPSPTKRLGICASCWVLVPW